THSSRVPTCRGAEGAADDRRTEAVVPLPPARAPAAAGGLPARLRPPPFGQQRVADRLRLRERPAAPATGAVRVAPLRQGGAPQPAAPALPRSVPADAARDAHRAGPDPDPAGWRAAVAGGVEGGAAAPGGAGRPQAGAGVQADMIAALRTLLATLL